MIQSTFKLGERVHKTMGVRVSGIVIRRFAGPYTDGQYRAPTSKDHPVFVRWDDGTVGWIDEAFLMEGKRVRRTQVL